MQWTLLLAQRLRSDETQPKRLSLNAIVGEGERETSKSCTRIWGLAQNWRDWAF